MITKADGDLCAVIIKVLEKQQQLANRLLDKAGNSGLKLLSLMHDHASKANSQDVAYVVRSVNKIFESNIAGEVNLESFNSHVETLEKKNRLLPPSKRKSEEDFIQMIHSIMYGAGGEIRNMYNLEVKAVASAPPSAPPEQRVLGPHPEAHPTSQVAGVNATSTSSAMLLVGSAKKLAVQASQQQS